MSSKKPQLYQKMSRSKLLNLATKQSSQLHSRIVQTMSLRAKVESLEKEVSALEDALAHTRSLLDSERMYHTKTVDALLENLQEVPILRSHIDSLERHVESMSLGSQKEPEVE